MNPILASISKESADYLRDRYFGDNGQADFQVMCDIDEFYRSFELVCRHADLTEPYDSDWSVGHYCFSIRCNAKYNGYEYCPTDISVKNLAGLWFEDDVIDAYAPHYKRLVAICNARDHWDDLMSDASDDATYDDANRRYELASEACEIELDKMCDAICRVYMDYLTSEYEYVYSDDGFDDWVSQMGEEELSYRLLMLERSIENDEREAARIRAELESL